jgi:TPR repeat protein
MRKYICLSMSMLLLVACTISTDYRDLLRNKEYSNALRVLTVRAEQGDAEAQSELGTMYANG